MKKCLKNERVKRRYLSWLRNAGGYCEATVANRERAIWRWEDFTQHSDFAGFCKSQAIHFKDWLLEREHNGRRISPISIYHTLRLLVFFFRWLSSQPGYRSKINWEDIAYLDPSRKLTRDALARKPIDYPTSDYVHRLTDSIGSDDELALRDRAMISTLFLGGLRKEALASLSLECLNLETGTVHQDPSKGVRTKYRKTIVSKLFPFSKVLMGYIADWVAYLRDVKGFRGSDPLFPRAVPNSSPGDCSFKGVKLVPEFWKGSGQVGRIIEARAQAAGMIRYKPHAFRHAAAHLAFKHCHSAEQIKAVSENLGHNYVSTTMMTYGHLGSESVAEVIDKIDFTQEPGQIDQQKAIEEAIRILKKLDNDRSQP